MQTDIFDFLDALQKKQLKGAFAILAKLQEQGVDIKYFLSQCLAALHEVLLVTIDVLHGTSYPLPNLLTIQEVEALVGLFTKAYQETKYAVVPQLPLELAVVEWCQTKQENLEKTEEVIVETPQVTVAVAKSGATLDEVRKKEQTLKVRSIIEGKKEEKKQKVIANVAQGSLKQDANQTAQLMENIIYKVKPYNHSLAGVLRGCDIASYTEEQLVLQTAYKFHQERLQDMKSLEILEKVIREITGKQIKVLVELKG